MGILQEDVVIISHPDPNKPNDPTIITVNCPDKIGLGCDLCRLILCFRLTILRVDVSTDGKWCYILFWVTGNESTRWSLLKKRLIEVSPSCSSASGIAFYKSEPPLDPPDVFLLKFFCHDNRHGLLHDVTVVLCELELVIKRLKISTTPEGRMVDLFFVTDTRGLLYTKKGQEETIKHLKDTLGTAIVTCEIEMVGPEIAACSTRTTSFLPPAIVDQFVSQNNESISISMDNSLSSSHTLVQIVCQDHKGLLYDITRTLKDYSIQISHGRFMKKKIKKKKNGDTCEVDLFILQSEGQKKIVEYRLHEELMCPIRVAVVSRGPDTELLVANPVELLSGKGRPLVFHDITLALKLLNTGIFSVCSIHSYISQVNIINDI
ncbi:ACT domain-containing protein ACR10-like [Impatiens glandulifera]|uniref:ACT domain-containing protein ACR10-like n=1 Tax=Impatiens glandulifera TaxID=253017 RepID=UPI001FB16AA5|nr:ACT domain-containing protein ACR10-like [Impatiens glandulifera]